MDPPPKRRRLSNDEDYPQHTSDNLPRTLGQPVSPPLRKKARPQGPSVGQSNKFEIENSKVKTTTATSPSNRAHGEDAGRVFSSPFHLTWIQDLPETANKDAISLRDLLGDPLIAECWEFNYLHDIDFLMSAFDQDVRDSVQVHLIHGFWKREDESGLALKVSLS